MGGGEDQRRRVLRRGRWRGWVVVDEEEVRR